MTLADAPLPPPVDAPGRAGIPYQDLIRPLQVHG
ncbi:MAG: hypothetical protein QOG76_4013, partial [Pseudonocardiales bacterium]|nr:hypothetical protein [Pseudonocardiales bacterium]